MVRGLTTVIIFFFFFVSVRYVKIRVIIFMWL